MTSTEPAVEADASPDAEGNARPYSVSELAFALKRTLEGAYGFVRLRGELSKVTFHGNGHVYLDIKDDKACIAGVIWKSGVRGLGVRPETGLEVVVTGRITTYPGRSQYQLIIETMTAAGVGALLAQLERLKARLQAEGLFAPERRRALPAMPSVIGVVTSPTGAVIRDILHRISERWPCHVIVWPVVVQGDQASAQVRAAIEGFAALTPGGAVPRPDLIIVARGGGSVEDLWPFNDEALARCVAASPIPLVSAVGHETDTTLIDFVSDRRAPTPTAAAEIVTPVLADLAASLADHERRMLSRTRLHLENARARLAGAAARLPRPVDVVGLAAQRLDSASGRLSAALAANVSVHGEALARTAGRLRPHLLERALETRGRNLALAAARLEPGALRVLDRAADRLANAGKLLESLNPDRVLARGYARVEHADGHLARGAAALRGGERVKLIFHDGDRRAVVDGAAPPAARPASRGGPDQGSLF
ncbi:MAG TPA: exodeoxyribonuclease VII large subunit [Caulobacteraceae bacterium]|jgi:exodeoxyribonuclease VII large subunit|nr:exodeoxyribonuclease VII large subunit [Caulobacteraceae bacterium]